MRGTLLAAVARDADSVQTDTLLHLLACARCCLATICICSSVLLEVSCTAQRPVSRTMNSGSMH